MTDTDLDKLQALSDALGPIDSVGGYANRFRLAEAVPTLIAEVRELKATLAEMTKARDEACYRWAQHRHDNGFDEDSHVEKLRAVGKETP